MTNLWNEVALWERIASMEKLGASVQELADEMLESILGYKYGEAADLPSEGHKPMRADLQKYKHAYDLWKKTLAPKDPYENTTIRYDNREAAKAEWAEKYGMNETEIGMVSLYQRLLSHGTSPELRTPQGAFEYVAKVFSMEQWKDLNNWERVGDPPGAGTAFAGTGEGLENVVPSQEVKRDVGNALKKYEQQNWPMFYNVIHQALDNVYRTGPLESYKLWPRMVAWLKDDFQNWLIFRNSSYNSEYQSPAKMGPQQGHIQDIVTEGGAVLSQLRAENKIPANFDANQLDFGDFENWLMDWKRDNREANAQGEVVYQFHDDWTIQKLTTPDQLQFEGDEMNHCVGSYADEVGSGETIIYSLRDPHGKPHVTMEIEALHGYRDDPSETRAAQYVYEPIHPDQHEPGTHTTGNNNTPIDETFEVVQIQGNQNHMPKPEYQRKIKEFLDALRAKGWNFVRSDNWYDPHGEDFDDTDDTRIVDAASLDDWYGEQYQARHHRYQLGGEDAYGMHADRQQPSIADWTNIMTECCASLIDDYDHSRWNTSNWQSLAQQTWHAWWLDTHRVTQTPEVLKQEAESFEKFLEKAQDSVDEWLFDQSHYSNLETLVVEKFEELAQKAGLWTQIDEEVDALFDNSEMVGDFDEEVARVAEEKHPDLWEQAREEVEGEEHEAYAGNAFRYLNYLHNLLYHLGGVNPGDLPDPNQRNGGLPSYDDLIQKNLNKMNGIEEEPAIEQGLPGALSKTATTLYHISPRRHRESIMQQGLVPMHDMQDFVPEDQRLLWIFTDPETARAYAGNSWGGSGGDNDLWAINGEGLELEPDRDRMHEHAMMTRQVIPPDRIRLAANDIQIHPIDQEHNVWFDEDGNQRERYRRGWVNDPATSKMDQTGPLEDSFLDKQGRQGEGYVAYHGERPIGSLTYVDTPVSNMLGVTYVHPDYREQGVFNRLAEPLRSNGKPTDAYVWNNPWLKQKVRGWQTSSRHAGVMDTLKTWNYMRKIDPSTWQRVSPASMGYCEQCGEGPYGSAQLLDQHMQAVHQRVAATYDVQTEAKSWGNDGGEVRALIQGQVEGRVEWMVDPSGKVVHVHGLNVSQEFVDSNVLMALLGKLVQVMPKLPIWTGTHTPGIARLVERWNSQFADAPSTDKMFFGDPNVKDPYGYKTPDKFDPYAMFEVPEEWSPDGWKRQQG